MDETVELDIGERRASLLASYVLPVVRDNTPDVDSVSDEELVVRLLKALLDGYIRSNLVLE